MQLTLQEEHAECYISLVVEAQADCHVASDNHFKLNIKATS